MWLFMAVACAQDLPLQDGDIVLHKSRSAQSAALRAATGSPYTHVGLVFRRNGAWQVLEAVQPVRWTPLSAWRDRGRDAHLVVVRSERPLTASEASSVRRTAEGYLGRDYDLLFQWSDDRIYCSELVYKAYDSIDRPIGDLVPLREFRLDAPEVQALMKKRRAQQLDRSELVVAPASMLDHAGFGVVYSTDPSIAAR